MSGYRMCFFNYTFLYRVEEGGDNFASAHCLENKVLDSLNTFFGLIFQIKYCITEVMPISKPKKQLNCYSGRKNITCLISFLFFLPRAF